jgi:gp16 family phage-associated protein
MQVHQLRQAAAQRERLTACIGRITGRDHRGRRLGFELSKQVGRRRHTRMRAMAESLPPSSESHLPIQDGSAVPDSAATGPDAQTEDSLSAARQRFIDHGISVASWAREMGFSEALVYSVLRGKSRYTRGESFKIAVALGLRKPPSGELSFAPPPVVPREDALTSGL